jgi:hypothetical protein
MQNLLKATVAMYFYAINSPAENVTIDISGNIDSSRDGGLLGPGDGRHYGCAEAKTNATRRKPEKEFSQKSSSVTIE